MGTKHDDDDLMLDTPYGRKRWGTIRNALDAHDDLLAGVKLANHFVSLVRLDMMTAEKAIEAAAKMEAKLDAIIAKAEGGA